VLPSHVYRSDCRLHRPRTCELAEIPIAEELTDWPRTFRLAIYQLLSASIGQMSTSLSPATQW
jgi:hypothetical protein